MQKSQISRVDLSVQTNRYKDTQRDILLLIYTLIYFLFLFVCSVELYDFEFMNDVILVHVCICEKVRYVLFFYLFILHIFCKEILVYIFIRGLKG